MRYSEIIEKSRKLRYKEMLQAEKDAAMNAEQKAFLKRLKLNTEKTRQDAKEVDAEVQAMRNKERYKNDLLRQLRC